MKMSDYMKLPVSDRFTPDFDDVSWPIVAHAINHHDKLVEALRWYVETDETNMWDPGNQFWIDGKNRAVELLASEDGE